MHSKDPLSPALSGLERVSTRWSQGLLVCSREGDLQRRKPGGMGCLQPAALVPLTPQLKCDFTASYCLMETQAPMCKGPRKPMAECTSPALLLQLLGFASLLNVPKRPLSPPPVSRGGRFVVATLLLEMYVDPHLSETQQCSTQSLAWRLLWGPKGPFLCLRLEGHLLGR